jgi:hypothetical protein
MHNKKFPPIVAIFAAAIAVFSAAKFARGATAPHIIINEIQTAGASSSDEFVEIFNPSDTSIILDGYKLSKKTKTGTESTLLSSATSIKFLGIIPAHGYFLIAHPDYKGSLPADLIYSSSSSISSDSTLLLYDKSGTLLDKVGFGAAIDSEGSPASNPSSNQSIERNDFSDTDNNTADFSTNISPSQQNSTIFESDDEDEMASDDGVDDPEEEADDNVADESTKCASSSENIKINEILPYPESSQEFIEIKNTGADCVDVSDWKVMDEAGHERPFPVNSIIEPGEYLYLEGNLYLNNDSDTAYLLDANGNVKDDALDKVFFERAKEDYSYALSDGSFFWTSTPTPGEINVITIPETAKKDTSETNDHQEATEYYISDANIFLNEILPNPEDGSDGEYIEIANGGAEPVDLFNWRLKDASKSKGYQFKEHILLNPGDFLAIYRPDSKIALNNSDESVYLYDPKNEIASSVSFDKSQKNASYSFDGKNWKWSKYLTPEKENEFDSEPKIKIEKPKKVYKNILIDFSAKAKDKETKKLKYSWDFGDGKKSYLKKPTHKYLDTGKYTITLSVTDESQTVEKSFAVNVKNYPRPDIEITKIVPNPAGNDSDGEIVEVKNNSAKKIDLTGWKIASGSGEKIFNHPISGEISIDPSGTKTITREFSKYSLNNEAGKVQLAGPDGKVIDEVAYSKEKIAEDEAFAKIDGEWQWIEPGTPNENADEADVVDEESDSEDVAEENTVNNGEVLGVADEEIPTSPVHRSYFSSEDAFIFLTDIGFLKSQNKEINYCPLKNTTASLEYFLISSI